MMFLILLIYSAYTDCTRREIPNRVILLLYLSSMLSQATITERIMGLFFPAFPLFFVALKYDCIKGGDVKFLSAVGAYLGLYNLAYILTVTTIIAVVFSFLLSEKSVPLATVFCIGYVISKIVYL